LLALIAQAEPNKMQKPVKLLISSALTFLFGGPAAADVTWTLTGTPTAGVSVSAYANTGNVGSNATQNAANNGAIQTIQAASLTSYSGGVGVTNADKCTSGTTCDRNEGTDPEHAIDNQQRYDMVLLRFDAPVKLTALKLGWTNNDSDMTVLAYTGTGPLKLVGLKYAELTSQGWTGIGHYANVGHTAPGAINAQGLVSSHWLIGAYNPLALNPLANPAGPTNFSATSYDFVKLAAVMGFTPIKAPEPSSAALTGLAVLGLIAVRRRRALVLTRNQS
jgi:hypothetical protein